MPSPISPLKPSPIKKKTKKRYVNEDYTPLAVRCPFVNYQVTYVDKECKAEPEDQVTPVVSSATPSLVSTYVVMISYLVSHSITG